MGGGAAWSVAISADGKRLATGRERAIDVFEFASGKKTATLRTGGTVYSVAFSPDGRFLASGGTNYWVVVWDAQVGQKMLDAHEPQGVFQTFFYSVRFSPDGKSLLSGSNFVRIWDTSSLANTLTSSWNDQVRAAGRGVPAVEDGAVFAVFSPNGKTIAAARAHGDGGNGMVTILDSSTLKTLGHLRGYSKRVICAAFSPDGRILATGGEGVLKVWDLASASEVREFRQPSGSVNSLAFSPDGKFLAGGMSEGNASLWDMATGQESKTLRAANHVHGVEFSPDGKYLITAGDDGIAKAWALATGLVEKRFPAESGLLK